MVGFLLHGLQMTINKVEQTTIYLDNILMQVALKLVPNFKLTTYHKDNKHNQKL